MTDKELSEKVKNLCRDLKVKLKVVGHYNRPQKSIMEFDNICDHDDNFLCECRLNWIVERIKKEFE